jgi:hypothetical protein
VVGSFEKCPPKYPLGTFCNGPTRFFRNFGPNVPSVDPEPLAESSFKKYPLIRPQCTQQVLLKVLTTNSQCGSMLLQTLKELIEYMIEYIVVESVGTF